jgi:hypothetical protein
MDLRNGSAVTKKAACCHPCTPAFSSAASKKRGTCHGYSAAACSMLNMIFGMREVG